MGKLKNIIRNSLVKESIMHSPDEVNELVYKDVSLSGGMFRNWDTSHASLLKVCIYLDSEVQKSYIMHNFQLLYQVKVFP